MRRQSRWAVALVTALGVVIGTFTQPSTCNAADVDRLRVQILELAGFLENENARKVKTRAADVAKSLDGIDELMHLMSLRRGKKGGLGVGEKAKAIQPDGIEAKITSLAKKELPNERLAKEAKDVERMAFITVVIAEVTKEWKSEGLAGKKKQLWLESAEGTRKAALELATASKKQDAAGVRKAALALETNCKKCHDLFEPTVPELIATLKANKQNDFVRAGTAAGLASLAEANQLKADDAKSVVLATIDALKYTRSDARSMFVDSLNRMGVKATTGIAPVNEVLRDTDDHIRFWFGYHLAKAGPDTKKAVPLLVQELKNSDAMIRSVAAEALGSIGTEAASAQPVLEEALNDKDTGVRRASAGALHKIGGKQSVLILIRSLKDKDPAISASAALALRHMGAAAVPGLTEALKEPDRYVRASAASALGRIGPDAKPAVPALREMLKDKDEYLRKVAGDALKKIEAGGKMSRQ